MINEYWDLKGKKNQNSVKISVIIMMKWIIEGKVDIFNLMKNLLVKLLQVKVLYRMKICY